MEDVPDEQSADALNVVAIQSAACGALDLQ